MSFVSFLGRLLFVSVFVLSAYQEVIEFGNDGGPTAKDLKPKFSAFSKKAATYGIEAPRLEMRHLIMGDILMKSLGSFLFVFGSTFGASVLILNQATLAPIMYDFYNYGADEKESAQIFVKHTQNLALIGALLFFIGTKNSTPMRSTRRKTHRA